MLTVVSSICVAVGLLLVGSYDALKNVFPRNPSDLFDTGFTRYEKVWMLGMFLCVAGMSGLGWTFVDGVVRENCAGLERVFNAFCWG